MFRSRRCSISGLVLVAGLAISLGGVGRAAAPKTVERVLVRKTDEALKRAAGLVRAKKYTAAGEAFAEAQRNFAELADPDARELGALVTPVRKHMALVRAALEKNGVELPPEATAPANPANKPAEKGVSFTKVIAPVLVTRCGNCHIQRSRGELNMGSYIALAKGSESGTVIVPRDAKNSRLIEVIASGEMPKGGGKVPAAELEQLTAWINEGAKFDGPDSAAPLVSFTSATPMAAPAADDKLKVVAAGARDEVQFARDLGPILLKQCSECHDEQNPRANFRLYTFERLLRGGDSGPVLVPGKPEESLLVKKLRGMAGKRMPLDSPALDEAVIVQVEKWIARGARFDGADPASPLEDTVALKSAEAATHDQLSSQRAELAARHWRLIMPDAQANREETASLLVYSSADPAVLATVARLAEEQVVKLRKLFKVPADEPFIKGRVTLYLFEKRFDYGEVGTMLERREIPLAWRGHWHFDPRDAYACVLLSNDGDAPPGLLAQQIAGVYVASLGKIPRWFAEGSARVAAARLDPKDPRVKAWDEQVGRTLTTTDKPEGFLAGKLQPEEGDLLSYSFVKYLAQQTAKHGQLLAALQAGTDFDTALVKTYGSSAKELIPNWLARANKRGR